MLESIIGFFEWIWEIFPLFWIIRIILMIIVGIIALSINKFASYSLRKLVKERITQETIKQLNAFKSYLVYGLALLVILGLLGVNPTILATSFGFLGLAIGFAARDVISNFLSGILLIIERSYSVGDVVQLGDTVGVVNLIKLRSTELETFDGNVVTIPNSKVASGEIINMTSGSERMQSLVWAKVGYEADIEKVKNLMEEAAKEVEGAYVNSKHKTYFEIKEVDHQWGLRVEMLFYLKAKEEPWIRSRVQEKVTSKLVANNITLHTLASRP